MNGERIGVQPGLDHSVHRTAVDRRRAEPPAGERLAP